MIRPDGSINIPIIEDSDANRIHAFAETISNKLTEALQTKVDIEAITHKYGFADTHEAMVIFYHEVMWDILSELVERGVVRQPAVFTSPMGMATRSKGPYRRPISRQAAEYPLLMRLKTPAAYG